MDARKLATPASWLPIIGHPTSKLLEFFCYGTTFLNRLLRFLSKTAETFPRSLKSSQQQYGATSDTGSASLKLTCRFAIHLRGIKFATTSNHGNKFQFLKLVVQGRHEAHERSNDRLDNNKALMSILVS